MLPLLLFLYVTLKKPLKFSGQCFPTLRQKNAICEASWQSQTNEYICVSKCWTGIPLLLILQKFRTVSDSAAEKRCAPISYKEA